MIGAPARRLLRVHLDDDDELVESFALSRVRLPLELEEAAPSPPGGRLVATSKAFFLDPDDHEFPLIRLNLAAMLSAGAPEGEHGSNSLQLHCSEILCLAPASLPAPFTRHRSACFAFALAFAHPPSASTAASLALNALDGKHPAINHSRDHVFDRSSLIDPLRERILCEFRCSTLCPLTKEAGTLALSQLRLYFQPTGCNGLTRSLHLSLVLAMASRHVCMQDLALELFLDTCDTDCLDCHVYWPNPNDDTSDKGRFSRSTSEHTPSSLLFLFLSERERSEFAAILNRSVTSFSENPEKLAAQCRLLEGQTAEVRKLQQLWRDSPTLSNFDYLLLLNLSAGRTFNDLSQWPVFPWVVQDFTSNELLLNYDGFFRDLSKPIGALNEERLAECWNRYKQLEEANEEPFLYGTHYSSPAYCLHFLLRDLPHHALKMQQGKFDKPDRLFSSVSGAFESALSTTSDIKELVPSFFSGPGSFLVNSRGLPLGYKQDGTAVNDVALPTWACSPKKFVEKHACALESEHVSEHLHWWIDLIFGCKQRGQAAIDASNIFHPLSYEDRAKEMLASAEDEQHKKSMMGHINEFGQVPRQLFGDEEPHPKRSTESATRAAEAHPHQNIVHCYPQHRIAIALKAAVG